jgi:hypothetical protein
VVLVDRSVQVGDETGTQLVLITSTSAITSCVPVSYSHSVDQLVIIAKEILTRNMAGSIGKQMVRGV